MSIKNLKREMLTIPNLLSLMRLGLIPVYLNLYQQHRFLISGAVLIFSCFTDFLDGKIARQFHMVSTVGKVLDPTADKATQIALTWCLSRRYPVLFPVLVLLGLKDFFQLLAAGLALMQGRILPGALWAGKLCTTVLFISLIILVLFPQLPQSLIQVLAVINTMFVLYAFSAYISAYYGRHQKTQNI